MLIRQGDVLFRSVKKTQKKGLSKGKSPILVHGEATGHAHRLSSLDGVNVFVDENGVPSAVEVSSSSVDVLHEEHGTVSLPKGSYDVILQREYHPEENRRVLD